LESNGIVYINQPDKFVYSRENWFYLTPSIKYKPFDWISMDLGMDIRLVGADNTTSGVPNKTNPDLNLPNYAPWKVHLGLNMRILPFAPPRKTTAEVEREQFKKRVEFFQGIVEDRERTNDVQEQLDKLKQERAAAEKELEELKQIMQEEEN